MIKTILVSAITGAIAAVATMAFSQELASFWPKWGHRHDAPEGAAWLDKDYEPIVAFNSATCPTGGWVPFDAADSRVLVGTGDGTSFGAPRTYGDPQQNVAAQSNGTYALGDTGGFVRTPTNHPTRAANIQTTGPSGTGFATGALQHDHEIKPRDQRMPYVAVSFCVFRGTSDSD